MNAVFIHIPKTAGLMVEKVLDLAPLRNRHRVRNNFKNHGHISFGHLDYLKMLKNGTIDERFHRTAFKFCFCRNPYDRAVSHYCYARMKHPDLLDPKYSFLEFTRMLETERIIRVKFRQQHTWIRGIDVDFIGRYENLDEDVLAVAHRLGKEVRAIPHINSSNHAPYRQFYDPESKERIEEFYAGDFERFGYGHDDTLVHGQLLSA